LPRLRSATNLGFAQQPTSVSLSNRPRFCSATGFGFALLGASASLNWLPSEAEATILSNFGFTLKKADKSNKIKQLKMPVQT
jgi:hypothetical protein